MKTTPSMKRSAFTLIEMLLVICIIAVLSGISFVLINLAGKKAKIGEVRGVLEKLAAAIEEYRAEYGTYPPVTVQGDRSVTYGLPNSEGGFDDTTDYDSHDPNSGEVFNWGLLSYLLSRTEANYGINLDPKLPPNLKQYLTVKDHLVEDARRKRMLRKTLPHLKDIVVGSSWEISGNIQFSSSGYYTNDVYNLIGEDHQTSRYRYESLPPHTTYRLWWVWDNPNEPPIELGSDY